MLLSQNSLSEVLSFAKNTGNFQLQVIIYNPFNN